MTETRNDVGKLADLIADVDIAMLTTIGIDGVLHSRPMYTQRRPFDGALYFFASRVSTKADELGADGRVNLSYASPKAQHYVSVSGTGTIVHDPALARELWNPLYRAWFPGGLDDPDLTLLRVDVERAEYWDSPSSAVVQLTGFIKAIATGARADGGEHGTVGLQ